jgi:hypothetical protein
MNDEEREHFHESQRQRYADRLQQMNDQEREQFYVNNRNRVSQIYRNKTKTERSDLFLRQSCSKKVINLRWSEECKYCGYMHLNNTTASAQRKCCLQGLAFDINYPRLMALTPALKHAMIEHIDHFSRASSSYNNILVNICYDFTNLKPLLINITNQYYKYFLFSSINISPLVLQV